MSLYREAGRGRARTLVTTALVALLIGAAVGFAFGRSSAPEPSAAKIGAKLRSQLQPVKSGLVLIPNEYAEAFGGAGSEGAGVEGALDRIEKQLVAAAPDLRGLDPKGVEQLSLALSRLKAAVARKAQPAEVKRLSAQLGEALAAVPGGS